MISLVEPIWTAWVDVKTYTPSKTLPNHLKKNYQIKSINHLEDSFFTDCTAGTGYDPSTKLPAGVP
ncbi:MAG TPA: hypothetical protein DCF63_18805 [Planctomycetaceae bacterium]|nr:hypothetical protein [Planctomycetaceae bacterium]